MVLNKAKKADGTSPISPESEVRASFISSGIPSNAKKRPNVIFVRFL